MCNYLNTAIKIFLEALAKIGLQEIEEGCIKGKWGRFQGKHSCHFTFCSHLSQGQFLKKRMCSRRSEFFSNRPFSNGYVI